jgi:hypothetical protein
MQFLLVTLIAFSVFAGAEQPNGLYLNGGLVDTKKEAGQLIDDLEALSYPWVSANVCFWFSDFAADEKKVEVELGALWQKTGLFTSIFNGWKDEFKKTFMFDLEFNFVENRYARAKVPQCPFR